MGWGREPRTVASLGSSSFLSPEHQQCEHMSSGCTCPQGDHIEQPEGIIQNKKNRGRKQRCGLGGEGCTLLAGAFSSHGSGSPCMGLARAVSSPELGLGREADFGLGHLAAARGTSQLTLVVGCHPSHPSSL